MLRKVENGTHSGMADVHREAVKAVAKELNTFFIIRPSEADTVRLINEEVYGTKSMDVHDKSSTWGPMAGFVPLDQSLCKNIILKGEQNPNPNILQQVKHAREHRHGTESPVHLYLTESVVKVVLGRESAEVLSTSNVELFHENRRLDSARMVDDVPQGSPLTFSTPQGTAGHPAWIFVAKPPTATLEKAQSEAQKAVIQTRFLICRLGDTYKAWWIHGSNELVPIMVWGYPVPDGGGRIAPVTGDYDLWMVVPHLKHWQQHFEKKKWLDEHQVPSVASNFTNKMLGVLNRACNREKLPVFNHGAEAQNFTFTQPLDATLLMITPCEEPSYTFPYRDLPKVLVDMLAHGYLPIWNARYDSPGLKAENQNMLAAGDQVRINDFMDELYGHIEALQTFAGQYDFRNMRDFLNSWRGLILTKFEPERVRNLRCTPQEYLNVVLTLIFKIINAIVRLPSTMSGDSSRAEPSVGSTSHLGNAESDIYTLLKQLGY